MMSKENNNIIAGILVFSIIVITALLFFRVYNTKNSAEKAEDVSKVSMTESQLKNTNWGLVSYANTTNNGEKVNVPEGIRVTLSLKEVAFSGNSGCNYYQGSYTVDNNSIKFGEMVSTMMYCGEEVGLVEGSYLSNLSRTSTYKMNSASLTFFDVDGNEILEYQAQKQITIEDNDWIASSINNGNNAVVGLPEGITVTAKFENGVVSGNSGCNSYSGSYTIDGNSIKIGEIATTMMFCEGAASEVESQYLTALKNADNYSIENEMLVLRQGDARQVDYVLEE